MAAEVDGFATFTEVEFTERYIKVRDALIEHLRELEEIKVDPAARVTEFFLRVLSSFIYNSFVL